MDSRNQPQNLLFNFSSEIVLNILRFLPDKELLCKVGELEVQLACTTGTTSEAPQVAAAVTSTSAIIPSSALGNPDGEQKGTSDKTKVKTQQTKSDERVLIAPARVNGSLYKLPVTQERQIDKDPSLKKEASPRLAGGSG